MADFCEKCFVEEFGNNVKNGEKIVVSKSETLCEGCGKIKPVVLKVRKKKF